MCKVLFLIPNLAHGGAERVLVNLVNNIDRDRFDVTLQTLFDEGINKKYLSADVKYKSFLRKQFRGNSQIMKLISPTLLYKIIIKGEYDIVISYLEGPTARIISGCQSKGTKKIAWFHTAPEKDKTFKVGFISRKGAMRAYSGMDKFVSVSKGVENAVKTVADQNWDNMTVLYNTIDSKRIKEMSFEKVSVGETRFEGIRLCSVGKLQPVKGFDRLIEACNELKSRGIKFRLFIIGKGEQENKLRELIERYNLTKDIILLGFQENPYKYMAACDVYVCSSRREGFSSTVAEALILGKPVISTDCSGAKEMLGEESEYGLVVDNSTNGITDGLIKILSEPELLETYKIKAKERGKSFEISETVSAVEQMLMEVIEHE